MISDKKVNSFSFRKNLFLVNVFLIFYQVANFHQIDATSCILRNGQVGECVKFEECRSAASLARKGYKVPLCNSETRTVCCTDNFGESEGGAQREDESQNEYSTRKESNINEQVTRDSERRKYNIEETETDTEDEGNYGDKIVNSYHSNDEESRKFEKTPNNLYAESGPSDKARRGNRRSKPNTYGYHEDTPSLPPGLAKKKPWRDERPTDNDYYYEYVLKKPNRGQSRKNSNKPNGESSYYDTNNQPRRPSEESTRRNDYSNQGGKRTTNNYEWYDNQNENHNGYSNQRRTTKGNKWTQETYTTTRRNEYAGNRPGNSHNINSGDEYYNGEPTRRPQQTSRPSNYPNRPYPQQGSKPQVDTRPSGRPGSHQKRRISERKCEEYSQEVIKNITGLPLTTNPDPVTIHVAKCVQAQELIVGGENTTLGEFPHMAAIGFRDRNKNGIAWNCGGTLISDMFVMTAAHCTSTSSGSPIRVRLGEYNLMKNDDGAHPVEYAITEIITHPDYKPPSKYNDIALLKLSRKVKFFNHIRPACLYSEDTLTVSRATATGWGRLYYDGSVSEILQKVTLTIVDNKTCNRLYRSNVKTQVLSRGIVDTQMCAGELSGGKDTCQGDSGGPLSIANSKCIHHVIGITSFGKSCALPNSTGVYTRVSAYIPWIERIVWPES